MLLLLTGRAPVRPRQECIYGLDGGVQPLLLGCTPQGKLFIRWCVTFAELEGCDGRNQVCVKPVSLVIQDFFGSLGNKVLGLGGVMGHVVLRVPKGILLSPPAVI